jgi:hypothetical protein
MDDGRFIDFHLVGGTALALQIGHRKSIDLDLFTLENFDFENLNRYLKENYGFVDSFFEKNTLKGFIEGIKVDFLTHAYPLVAPVVTENNVRMYAVKDIVAMKLNAIVHNGTRVKDFIDIAWISTIMSLSEMLKAYETKYRVSYIPALKSLLYFDDIDFNEPVQMTNEKFQWKFISKRLEMMSKFPERIFPNPVSSINKQKSKI